MSTSESTLMASASDSAASIAWLGLGHMGSAMVERLVLSGERIAVWNRTPSRMAPWTDRGLAAIDRLADACDHDVVYSMVLDDKALASLHDPRTGLFSGPADRRRATVWIDGSTVSPGAALAAAEDAHSAGLSYVSAPVSGNAGVVRSGGAIFALSGDIPGLDVAERITRLIGREVYRVGTGAEANIVKLGTNALLAVTMQSLAEVAVLADKAGVSRAALMAFLNDSAVGSAFSRYKTANIVGLDFSPTFSAENQRKDIRLALDLARAIEVPLPILTATEVEFSRLVSGGLGVDRDYAALILDVARDAGHELRPEGGNAER